MVSYLMVFPDRPQSRPHRHNHNAELILNSRKTDDHMQKVKCPILIMQQVKNGIETNKNVCFPLTLLLPGVTPGKFWLILHKHKQNKRAVKQF